jgi:ubiquinone/menaquinone biosynthesis C-methylase UbiE
VNNQQADAIKEKFRADFNEGMLFEAWHDIYDRTDYLSTWAYDRLQTVLKTIDNFHLAREGKSLDIGIGSGVMLEELAGRGTEVWGTDYSETIIQQAYEKYHRLDSDIAKRLVHADIEHLPFDDNAFNLVTCLGVLEYLFENKRALGELHRILSPGGYLVLSVASYHRFGTLLSLAVKKIQNMIKKNKPLNPGNSSLHNNIRLVKPLALRRDAVESGFQVTKFQCFGGKLFGRYHHIRFTIPGMLYVGDHCLLLLKKP